MSGAFILPRSILKSPIWASNVELRLFLLILGNAIFTEEGYAIGEVHLRQGQWLRSYRNIQTDLEYIDNNAVRKPGLATIRKAVDKLVSYELITVHVSELGTVFEVVDYAKYRDFNSFKKRARNTARNDARNNDGTQPERSPNNNKQDKQDKQDIYTAQFETLWNAYPKKRNKEQGRAAFEKLMKAGEDVETILSGTRKYAAECIAEKTEPRFIANASTFLNQKRYAEYSGDRQDSVNAILGLDEGVTVLI